MQYLPPQGVCELAEENLQKQAQQKELWCHSLLRGLRKPRVCYEGGKSDLSLSRSSLTPCGHPSLLLGEAGRTFASIRVCIPSFLSFLLICLVACFQFSVIAKPQSS